MYTYIYIFNQTFIACPAFCIKCEQANTCLACQIGYYLDSGSCKGEFRKIELRTPCSSLTFMTLQCSLRGDFGEDVDGKALTPPGMCLAGSVMDLERTFKRKSPALIATREG